MDTAIREGVLKIMHQASGSIFLEKDVLPLPNLERKFELIGMCVCVCMGGGGCMKHQVST